MSLLPGEEWDDVMRDDGIILAESTLRTLYRQNELYERAVSYGGRPRERVVALGEAEEIYFRLYPHHYRVLQTVRIAAQLGNVTAGVRNPIQKSESRLISLLMNLILDGLKTGDLRLHDRQRPTELAFTLWSLAFGTRALMDTGVATRQLGINDGFRVARDATTLLLDSLGWAPLSPDWDYGKTREDIRQGLFGKEWEDVSHRPVSRTA
jgi:hypothetical protein